jgi:hypothetical protein
MHARITAVLRSAVAACALVCVPAHTLAQQAKAAPAAAHAAAVATAVAATAAKPTQNANSISVAFFAGFGFAAMLVLLRLVVKFRREMLG